MCISVHRGTRHRAHGGGAYDCNGWALSPTLGSSSANARTTGPDATVMLSGFTAIWVVLGTILTYPYPSSCDPHELSYTASLLTLWIVVHHGSVSLHHD